MAQYRTTSCCGLAEIADVGASSDQGILDAITFARREHAGRCFATTTDDQGEGVKAKMERLGFKPIDRFRNPNTNRMITLWLIPTRRPNPVQKVADRLTRRPA